MVGACIHTSELPQQDRQLIEDAFRQNLLHTLVATTTLAAGVNLPAKFVIINGLKIGIEDINAQYYRQMCGRAGRTKNSGVGICILYLDKNIELLERCKKLNDRYMCLSQIMQDDYINNTINSILMMGYQFNCQFEQVLKHTLYGTQNPDKTPPVFKKNVQFLLTVGLIQKDP